MANHQIDFEDARGLNGIVYDTVEQDGGLLITKKQDVQAILRRAKFERDNFPEHHGSYGKDMVKAATIPNIIVEQLMKEGIWQDKKRFKDWLNQYDNRCFRTSAGKV